MNKSTMGMWLGVSFLLSFLAFPAFPQQPAAAETPEDHAVKINDIKKLMMMTGASDMGSLVLTQMVDSFKISHPDVAEEFWKDFMAGVNTNELLELNIPLYDKHLTHEEIKATIAFYETAVGQKLIQILPSVADESYEVGQKWSVELENKLMKKLEESGHK